LEPDEIARPEFAEGAARADDREQPHFARDDRRVAQDAAHFGHETAGAAEEGRERRLGERRDEDVSRLESVESATRREDDDPPDGGRASRNANAPERTAGA